MSSTFAVGLDVLLAENLPLLYGCRVGMLVHPASVNGQGVWTPDLLWDRADVNLVALFGPEHGVFGQAGPGEQVESEPHPRWGIPMYSLYGEQRQPTAEMLGDIDVLVVDLQDLAVRCYTFVSTLQLVLRACADAQVRVIVADRPVPFPNVIDGPMLDPAFSSFVASAPVPFVYGMTPGEVATYLVRAEDLQVEVFVACMRNYHREATRQPNWPPWVPPSTGIRSWETASCYPATVMTEALPSLDCDRGGLLPFQVLGAPWMVGEDVCRALASEAIPGGRIVPYDYVGPGAVGVLQGLHVLPHCPDEFMPVTAGLMLLETIQSLYGAEVLWHNNATRPDFFDQLYGTDAVRLALQRAESIGDLYSDWQKSRPAFMADREQALLYARGDG